MVLRDVFFLYKPHDLKSVLDAHETVTVRGGRRVMYTIGCTSPIPSHCHAIWSNVFAVSLCGVH